MKLCMNNEIQLTISNYLNFHQINFQNKKIKIYFFIFELLKPIISLRHKRTLIISLTPISSQPKKQSLTDLLDLGGLNKNQMCKIFST